MNVAYPFQKIQDWLTQQWVIFTGVEINESHENWLLGPFGDINGIGEKIIHEIAEKEGLIIDWSNQGKGLIPDFNLLAISANEMNKLNPSVIDFYENTSNYQLELEINWNPFFKIFGFVVNILFSKRINQLNIPTKTPSKNENLNSEIIHLLDPKTNEVKYTWWLSSHAASGNIIYSGIYGVCTLPSGKKCVKAIFPLPNGSATVILNPMVLENGTLVLDATGNEFGDAGFYFVLKDSKDKFWSKYIRSFRDTLTIYQENDGIKANQNMTLWNLRVLTFTYIIALK